MSQPIVLITGASRGLGEATARALAQMGARVVLNARSSDDLVAVAGRIRSAGGTAEVVVGDVSAPEICERLIQTALDRFGRIDALINNAAMLEPIAAIGDAERDDWTRHMAVNVIGPVLLTRAALASLRSRKGRVINVSSGAAVHPKATWAAYGASKSALNHLTTVLALEEPEITALAVAPGIIDTEMQALIRERGKGTMQEKDYQRFVGLHERGELRSPDEPGRALAVLALHAPHEWSGMFVTWDEDRITELVQQHTAS
ncbi:SDR family NAD(P)-dependent oxidoreductase [Aggregatilinea lenta]|uniref:SDR family NAD(P)-dependent oxidoreductase n=1 Tax=Aggregatilinea lenta TaxID=913108 RepID=UPI0013C2F304|nr:SDR family NAD(P)-dependent oxidoreductase [Aggregatilinea lenta]